VDRAYRRALRRVVINLTCGWLTSLPRILRSREIRTSLYSTRKWLSFVRPKESHQRKGRLNGASTSCASSLYRSPRRGPKPEKRKTCLRHRGVFSFDDFSGALQGCTNVAGAQDARSDHEQRKVTCRGSTTHKLNLLQTRRRAAPERAPAYSNRIERSTARTFFVMSPMEI
jgi:hypothetical protein